MQRPGTGARSAAFGLSAEDADDYYDVLPSSDEESSDDENLRPTDGAETLVSSQEPPTTVGVDHELVRLVASASLATSSWSTAAPVPSNSVSSAIFTPIGSMGGAVGTGPKTSAPGASPPSKDDVDDELQLTEEERARHTERRSQLEMALDAARTAPRVPDSRQRDQGEAPFRFRQAGNLTSPSPTTMIIPTEGHGPMQSEYAKKKKSTVTFAGVTEEHEAPNDMRASDDDQDDESMDGEQCSTPDSLYDEAMDDADEEWVSTNLRRQGGAKTDALLCCPCCFVTVCMDCERHTRYPNQYRARVAMNCRVNKDEILTYTTTSPTSPRDASTRSPHRHLRSMDRSTHPRGSSSALGESEYFGVLCSDCRTTVGVYDHNQFYHFFNVLPSHS